MKTKRERTKREEDKEGDDKKGDDKEGEEMLMRTKKKLNLKNLKAKYCYGFFYLSI